MASVLTMNMVDEIGNRGSAGLFTLLFERISGILRKTHIESCEWAAIVVHAQLFVPLLLDPLYLIHSPYARQAVAHIPYGSLTVIFISGIMFFLHIATCLFGGQPSFFIKREEDQLPWYGARITCTLLSCAWFCIIWILYSTVQITGGTVLYGSACIVEYIGSHKLYKLLSAERSYLLRKRAQGIAEEMLRERLVSAE